MILKRIPRASQELAAVLVANNPAAWNRLFSFCSRCLRASSRGGRQWNLGSEVNRQIREEVDPASSITSLCWRQWPRSLEPDPLKSLAARVATKLEWNFKGTVHLAYSEDTIANMSDATLAPQQQKQPTAAH